MNLTPELFNSKIAQVRENGTSDEVETVEAFLVFLLLPEGEPESDADYDAWDGRWNEAVEFLRNQGYSLPKEMVV